MQTLFRLNLLVDDIYVFSTLPTLVFEAVMSICFGLHVIDCLFVSYFQRLHSLCAFSLSIYIFFISLLNMNESFIIVCDPHIEWNDFC